MSRENNVTDVNSLPSDKGATIVEFLIIAPIFFVVVFGIFEICRYYAVRSILQNAAHEGIRRATVLNGVTKDLRAGGTIPQEYTSAYTESVLTALYFATSILINPHTATPGPLRPTLLPMRVNGIESGAALIRPCDQTTWKNPKTGLFEPLSIPSIPIALIGECSVAAYPGDENYLKTLTNHPMVLSMKVYYYPFFPLFSPWVMDIRAVDFYESTIDPTTQASVSTPTLTPTNTPTATPTASATSTATPSAAGIATSTATPSNAPTSTATPSPTKAATVTATPTKAPSAVPTPSATRSIAPTVTPSKTPTATVTPSPTKATPSMTPTTTPTPTKAPSAAPTPSATRSVTPTATPSRAPSATATSSPTKAVTPSMAATTTPTPTTPPCPLTEFKCLSLITCKEDECPKVNKASCSCFCDTEDCGG